MGTVEQKSPLAAIILLVLLLGLAAANLFDFAWFWSISFSPYYPSIAVYAAIGLILLVCWRPVREILYGILARAGEKLVRMPRTGQMAVLGLAALIFLVLTVLLSSATNLTGDASLRLNQLDAGRWWLPTEAGDFALHALWNRLISQPLGLDAATTYRWISIICGSLFVINAGRLSLYLSRERTTLLFPLLFTGTAALFFGYIESYALIAALLPQLVLSALKAVDGRGSRWAFVFWFLLGTVVHSVTPILFAGALLVVLAPTGQIDSTRRRKLNRLFVLLTALGLLVLILMRSLNLLDLPRFVLGVGNNGPYEISLLSTKHLQNVIGWLLLTSLPFLILLPNVTALFRNTSSSARRFLATWIILPPLLFMLFFLPQLGGVRDWDLFALAGWILSIGAVILINPDEQSSERRIGSWLVPAALMTLLVTGAYVGINASRGASVDRFARTLDQSRVRNQIWEYLNLIDHVQSDPALSERVPEFASKAWQQPPYRTIDSLNIIRRLHGHLVERGGTNDIVRSIASTLDLTYNDQAAWLLLACYFLNTDVPREQRTLAEILARNLPASPRAQMYAGVINLQQGKLSLARQQLGRAYQLDSSDADIVLNYGALKYETGDMLAAERLFERALTLDSTSYLACYNLALIAERDLLPDRADSLARRAMALTAVPAQQQSAQTLLQRLGRR